MRCSRNKIRCKDYRFPIYRDFRKHHRLSMSIGVSHSHSRYQLFAFAEKAKFAALLHGKNILFQKGGAFAFVGFGCPFPVFRIAPEGCVRESRFVAGAVFVPTNTAAAMIKVQVTQHHVGDVIKAVTVLAQGFLQGVIAIEEIMGKELFVLLVAEAVIDEDLTIAGIDEQASHGPVAHVVLIGRVQFVPNGFWNNAEHGATIEFEITTVDREKFHVLFFVKIRHLIRFCFCRKTRLLNS